MAKRKLTEYERQRTLEERLKKAAWTELWKQPEYVKLDARAQKALHEWNQLDAWKNTPSGRIGNGPEDLKRADAKAKRLLQEMYAFENTFIAEYIRQAPKS